MSWFDTHCHLQSFLQEKILDATLSEAKLAGVQKMVTVGTSPKDWTDYQKLSQKYSGTIYFSVGLHPGYVGADWEDQLTSLPTFWTGGEKPVALGEIGLDYFRLPKDKNEKNKIIELQKNAFRTQLSLAKTYDCPVIIHSRSAFQDCIEEIDRSGVDWGKIVFHCFTEGPEEILQLMERGGRASFTGILTFSGTDRLSVALKNQGLNRLMLETDSPYLAPVPHRGKRNGPAKLPIIGNYVSELFGVSVDELSHETFRNSSQFYKLKERK